MTIIGISKSRLKANTAKEIAEDYNDQRKEKTKLLATEIVSSYFQDLFPTIHYTIVLGGNGSGKSSYGDTYTATGYRVVNLTDPNAANINRILGSIEAGQCTIVSDETGPIDKNQDLMAVLKTGYSPTGKTSKVNDYSRAPEFFHTYCFKIIISERMPNLRDAKGVIDRSFTFTTYKGKPRYDIKETLIPQRNPARLERLAALNDFRKLMLIYRLIHFEDAIADIDIGVEGREKELSKPIIQLFYNSKSQKEVEKTLQYFLDSKAEKKEITLEPILHPIVTNLVAQSKRPDKEISIAEIWDALRETIHGYYDEKNNLNTNIQTKLMTTILTEQNSITKDEGMKAPSPLGKPPNVSEEENHTQNQTQNHDKIGGVLPIEPSEPSNNNQEQSSNDKHSLYWSNSNWACHNCKLRGDKFTMQNISCKRDKK